MSEPKPSGGLRTAWAAVRAPEAGVTRGARLAAAVIPFTVLPASIWRIAGITFHLPLDGGLDPGHGQVPAWLPMEVYVLLISVLSEVLALLAFGLIAGWGEVWPHWIPRLRGRPVPVLAAVVPAGLGATILTAMWSWATVSEALGRTAEWRPLPPDNPMTLHDWHSALLAAAYAPLVLWGPLLGWLTLAYWRRRTGSAPRPAVAVAGITPLRPRPCPPLLPVGLVRGRQGSSRCLLRARNQARSTAYTIASATTTSRTSW